MNFLHPAILYALAAVLLPLLIHLLTRSRSRTIPFSTLRFLLELQQQKIRKLKLRQLLLLLVRTLIILALVLGFARPTCRSTFSSAVTARAGVTAVLIVDNSLSMGCQNSGYTLFERARTAAGLLLQSFQPGDEVYLVTTTDTTREWSRISFRDFNLLQKQIEQLPMDGRPTRFNAALRFGDRLLAASHNINKELFVIADLQKSGFSGDSLHLQTSGVRRFAIPITASGLNNLSCTQVRLLSTIMQKDKMIEGRVLVHNSGSSRQRNRLVQIYLNNKQVAQCIVDLEAGASVEASWKCVLDQSGFLSGSVILEDDDWLDDNRSYFCFYVPDKIRMGLLGAETTNGYFMQLALQPKRNQPSPFVIHPLQPQQLAFQQPADFDVMAVCDVPSLSTETVEWLLRFVDSGKGMLLAPGANTDLRAFNQGVLARFELPLFLEEMGSRKNKETSFSLGKTDMLHPVFSGLYDTEQSSLGEAIFYHAFRCQPTPTMNKIINFSSGDPFLYEVRRPAGVVMAFTSGFDESSTDLAYRAVFAPLMHRCVSYLNAAGRPDAPKAGAGEVLRFRLPVETLGQSLSIERPDQKQDRPMIVSHGATGQWAEYAGTDRIGIYRLLSGETILTQWAVNLAHGESDLTPMDFSLLEKKFDFHFVADATALTEEIRQQRIGKELWRYFLLAALLLMLVEMALYYERKPTETAA